jgi:YD repeat-containing protein
LVTAAFLVGASGALVGTSAASATPAHWEDIHEEYGPEVYEDFCDVAGFTVEQSVVLDGRVRITTQGPDGLSYYSEHIVYTDTWTNVATGESMTTVVSSGGGDLKITDNGDGTLTILVQSTATQLTYDDAGQLIDRSAGLFRYEYLVDHAGTPTDPTDDTFLKALGSVKTAGRSADFCNQLISAIG